MESFKKSFNDGMILCALVHKYRPDHVPFQTLSRDRPSENFQVAMDAAQKWFDLEKFLKPEEVGKLEGRSGEVREGQHRAFHVTLVMQAVAYPALQLLSLHFHIKAAFSRPT